MSQLLPVTWYRFRSTLGRDWGAYLSVVLLIGLTGGIAMASIGAARRTQSSYPRFLASTNPSDMTVSVYNALSGDAVGPLTAPIARIPDVTRVAGIAAPSFILLGRNGAPLSGAASTVTTLGSLDGGFVDQDRPAVVRGRLADPARPGEVVVTESVARTQDLHLGQAVSVGLYTPAQEALPQFGTPAVAPRLRVELRLVGVVEFNNAVVQDDIDAAYGFVIITPALVLEVGAVSPGAAAPVGYAIQLEHGYADVPAVETAIGRIVPSHATAEFHVTSRVVTEVELAIRPESVALGGFGAIAAVVCLLLGSQAVARQLRRGEGERRVMRAIGAGPAMAAADGMIGVLGGVAVGSLLAVAVAVALSPLSPVGPVRPVYPHPGVAFDWTVLGGGLAVLVAGLGAVTVALAYWRSAGHVMRGGRAPLRRSNVAGWATAVGVPVAGAIGMDFALEPRGDGSAAPVRSALLGTVVAVTLVVATLTFASSIRTLVSHPSLYGWNWTYALNPSNNVPPQTAQLLDTDRDVEAWSGYDYNNVDIDSQTVPVLLARTLSSPVSPPILSGHGVQADDQIVVGAATLAVLHKHVGDSVSMSYGSPADAPLYLPPTTMTIVGTATFPAVGFESLVADHTSMGTGALIPEAAMGTRFLSAVNSPDPNLNGPALVFVRMRPGLLATAGRSDLQRIADAANTLFAADPNTAGNTVSVLGVQRPAQIVNYRTIGTTPVLLAIGLAAGTVVALGLTLAASVRRRRRDLGLLKALGFTHRQLAAAVASQATVAGVIGLVVGIPFGVVLGRQLWILFAHDLDAVPDPTLPLWSILFVVAGAIGFANLAAALPGRSAARTSTALGSAVRVTTHPTTSRDTRVVLHRIAAHVLGRRRFDVCGRFGLRASPGGFATPAFGPTSGGGDGQRDDAWPETVRVSGIALVREKGGDMTAVPIPGATLRQLATFVDADVESDFEAGKDTPSIGDPDDPIDLDAAHVGVISDWLALGWPVLDELVTTLGPAARPATLQLWPEHFDAGTHVGLPGGARANLGVSPGDDFETEPYLYVGPWTEPRPGDPTYWNAPFGAAVGAATVLGSPDPRRAALDFFLAGIRNLSTGGADT